MAHANARLTPAGRLTLVGRIAAQPRRPIAHIAHEMGVSRTTAYRWWGRYQQLGEAGLVDRPSIPLRSPRRTAARLEERILRLRRRERLGPARIAARLGLPASTVHRVLVRHQLNRLAWLDRPTGRPIRRYEHPRPGDLVHLDVKKLGRIPAGVATESTAGPLGRSTVALTGQAVATTTCMPQSTTTRGWPMSRCWVTSAPRAALGSGVAPTAGSPCMASPSIAYSPITGSATAAGCSGRRWPTPAYATSAPGPIGRRRTARWSGSTGPCWRSGPIGGRTAPTPPATAPCSPGSTGTTITEPTPPSVAGRQSAASTTSPAITTRQERRPDVRQDPARTYEPDH
jgi:transposase-like protein